MICSKCEIEKPRIFLKDMQRGKYIRKVYIDDFGRQWNSRECPDCKNLIRQESKGKVISGKRNCLKCKNVLSINKFYHSGCLDKMIILGEEYAYC